MSHIDYQLLWQSADITNRKLYDSLALVTDQRDELLAALMRVDEFITNGIALGFIRMPDADCPDSAHQVPGIVREAIAKAVQP